MIGRGEHDAAIEHLRAGLKGTASDVDALGMMAMLHQWAGRNDEAILLCRKVIAYDPQDFNAHSTLAQLLAEKGEDELASEHARKGLEYYPEPLEIPRYAIALYRALTRLAPRLWSAEIENTLRNPGASNVEWFEWATQYLRWYDETFGGDQTPSQH